MYNHLGDRSYCSEMLHKDPKILRCMFFSAYAYIYIYFFFAYLIKAASIPLRQRHHLRTPVASIDDAQQTDCALKAVGSI